MKIFIRRCKVVLLIVAFSIFLLQSCEKAQPACSGNCVDVSIKGKIVNQTNGTGIGGIPVTVTWIKRQTCYGCTSYKVAEGQSQTDGSFSFSSTIDSAFFKEYLLMVRIPFDSNYISIPDGGGIHYKEISFSNLDIPRLQQIRFDYYQPTNLTIRLRRTQNDVFTSFNLTAKFLPDYYFTNYSVAGQQNAHDTTLTIQTALNRYIYIYYGKILNGVAINNNTDSILCSQSGPNVINLSY